MQTKWAVLPTWARQFGDRIGQAATLDSLGYAQHRLGDHAAAAISYRQAAGLYAAAQDPYNEADALRRLGGVQVAAGDQAAARRSWRRALDPLDTLGHPEAAELRAVLAGAGLRGM